VLDLLPRPTWRAYPGWDASKWRNQLKFIRGEPVQAAPTFGTQLPDIVVTTLWPVEHCGADLVLDCWLPFVGTRHDWIEQTSFDAWVRPLIHRVQASAKTRYDYGAM
jgi:hypothetical protein